MLKENLLRALPRKKFTLNIYSSIYNSLYIGTLIWKKQILYDEKEKSFSWNIYEKKNHLLEVMI